MSSAHSAGVALIATSSDRPTASRKAVASGRKKAPCSPDSIEDRQERDRHRRGGEEHRAAHLERGIEEQRAQRTPAAAARRRRVMFSTSMTASSTTTPSATTRPPRLMVFSDQPAEAQDPHRGEQRHRDGAEGDERAAPVAQREQQQQPPPAARRRASELRSFADRALDEARRPQQRRMVLHAALRQRRHQRLQPLLELARDVERVGAVLRGGLHQDAGLPADDRITEARRGAVAHLRHVGEADGHAAAAREHRLPRAPRARHPAAAPAARCAAWRSLEVAAAGHLRAAARRLEHILEADAARGELHRVDQQLPLARIAAEDLRLRDPGHARGSAA